MIPLSADIIDNVAMLDLDKNKVRLVWLSVKILSDAQLEVYRSRIQVKSNGIKIGEELFLEFEIVNQLLPPPSQWTFHLDLWQHPSSVARINHLEMWSDAHFEKMRPIMKMLANTGQPMPVVQLDLKD